MKSTRLLTFKWQSTEDPQRVELQLVAPEGIFLRIRVRRAGNTESEEEDPEQGEGEGGRADPTPTLEQVQEENRLLTEEVSSMRTKLQTVNVQVEDLWKANCSLAREFEEVVQSKDDEIADQLASMSAVTPPIST